MRQRRSWVLGHSTRCSLCHGVRFGTHFTLFYCKYAMSCSTFCTLRTVTGAEYMLRNCLANDSLAAFAVNWRDLWTRGWRWRPNEDIAHSCFGALDTRSDLTLTFMFCCKGAYHGLLLLEQKKTATHDCWWLRLRIAVRPRGLFTGASWVFRSSTIAKRPAETVPAGPFAVVDAQKCFGLQLPRGALLAWRNTASWDK